MLIEFPPAWVSTETEAAEKHSYQQAFRETFAKFTGDKPIQADSTGSIFSRLPV